MSGWVPADTRKVLRGWVVLLVATFVVLTAVGTWTIERQKIDVFRRMAAYTSPEPVEEGMTAPVALPEVGDFTPVTVGLFLEDIGHVSIKDSFWGGTMRVWFRWKGPRDLNPAGTFKLVGGDVSKKTIVTEYFGEDGVNYQSARFEGRVTKFFDTTRIPLDDHVLFVTIEDGARDGTKLRYVADPESGRGHGVKVVGYDVSDATTVIKPHTYRRGGAADRDPMDEVRTFTDFVFGVTIRRESFGLYFKLLVGLFAGIGMTMCSFFIRPCDTSPRFSLPTASYFGAVSNSYLLNSSLPSNGQFGLTDIVTSMGLFTIFICVVGSLISSHYWLTKKDHEFARLFDRVTRDTVALAYLLANIIFPLTAFSRT